MNTLAVEEPQTVAEASDQPARTRPAVAVAAAALILLHAAVAWLMRAPGIMTRQDDAFYVILARSLRAGGYQELFTVGAPAHAMYPPGYPTMLALWGIPGEGYDWLVLFSVFCSAATLSLTFLAVRNIASSGLALVCLLALALNRGLLESAGSIASEAPYAALVMLVLYLFTRPEPSARRLGLIGTLAILAAMTRSIGVTLLAAVWLHFVLERRWKAALLFAVACALTVGAWIQWTTLAPDQFAGRSYVADVLRGLPDGRSPVTVLWDRVMERLPVFIGQRIPLTLGFPATGRTILDNVAAAALVCGGGLSGTVFLIRRWRPAVLNLFTYLGLLLVWTWSSQRFLVPLAPLLAATVLIGIALLVARFSRKAGVWAAAAVALVVAAAGADYAAAALALRSPCRAVDDLPPVACLRQDQISYFNALRYIRARLPEDAVLYSFKPEPLYLYTGRLTVNPRAALADRDSILDRLRADGAGYILLGSLQAAEILRVPRALEPVCGRLAAEMFFPARTYLFRIRDPDEPSGVDGCMALERFVRDNANRNFETDP